MVGVWSFLMKTNVLLISFNVLEVPLNIECSAPGQTFLWNRPKYVRYSRMTQIILPVVDCGGQVSQPSTSATLWFWCFLFHRLWRFLDRLSWCWFRTNCIRICSFWNRQKILLIKRKSGWKNKGDVPIMKNTESSIVPWSKFGEMEEIG